MYICIHVGGSSADNKTSLVDVCAGIVDECMYLWLSLSIECMYVYMLEAQVLTIRPPWWICVQPGYRLRVYVFIA